MINHECAFIATQNESQPDEQTLSQYAEHTRKSLIARLENWEDQRTWDEFYRTYWRLIYSVALKAGLREDEAWDVVQETILSIAKQSKKNIYKPEQGSFKLWLWNMTRWRINDQFRKRKKDTAMLMNPDAPGTLEHPIDKIPDEGKNNFDQVWEREWQNNLLQAALERVKAKVSPKQFLRLLCPAGVGRGQGPPAARSHDCPGLSGKAPRRKRFEERTAISSIPGKGKRKIGAHFKNQPASLIRIPPARPPFRKDSFILPLAKTAVLSLD
ncbi:MAG: RNA polymerase sigma factor [Akkermansia sp.]